MTAPIRQDITIDEMAARNEDKPPVKATDIKLDADDLPDDMKGKTAADIAEMINGLRKSLVLSEEERKRLTSQPPPASASVAAVPVEPAPEPDLSEEQLKKLFEENPIKAISVMTEQANKKAEANWNRRINQLVGGSVDSLKSDAVRRYPEEFQLFGTQIEDMLTKLPNPQAMASPKAWDDLISYIRGQPQNMDKLFEHRNTKAREANARQAQIDSAGPATRTDVRAPVPTTGGKLDDVEREIARNLGLSEADYIKWKQVA